MTRVVEKIAAPVYKARAKADGRSHIKINWSKVKNADGYTVYRSEKADKPGKKIYTTDKTSKKSYKDKTASVGKKYWYTVKAWKKVNGKRETIAVIKAKKVKNSLKYESSFQAKTYAYSGGGTTASGKRARVGRVAVDPNVIKLGTWLYIEDYGLCQAADTGGAIKGNKIDLYMNSTSDCYQWGIRHKQVYILA
jgi:3D (Asp-Asp-Asp) domain-containing protein